MNNIPKLTPNANIAEDDSSESIQIATSSNLKDITIEITPPCGHFADSMAPNNIESIGAINL